MLRPGLHRLRQRARAAIGKAESGEVVSAAYARFLQAATPEAVAALVDEIEAGGRERAGLRAQIETSGLARLGGNS